MNAVLEIYSLCCTAILILAWLEIQDIVAAGNGIAEELKTVKDKLEIAQEACDNLVREIVRSGDQQ